MISVPEVVVERVVAVAGRGEPLADLAAEASRAALRPSEIEPPAAVVAATFSNPDRFPSLAVTVASALGLPPSTPAFDVQMACSAYPYALYLAGRLAADTGKGVLVVDGDVQTPLVDAGDHATGKIFSDACTATVVSSNREGRSQFDFLSRRDDALTCSATGPIRMDGFRVFAFVATEVSKFLGDFLAAVPRPDFFAPHQANPYMVRQLADALSLKDRLLTIPDELKNPGSCSVPFALAQNAARLAGSRVLAAGFGAGYSAAAALVAISPGFSGETH